MKNADKDVPTLEKEAKARGVMPAEGTGTGANGNVVKADLVAALDAADAAEGKADKGTQADANKADEVTDADRNAADEGQGDANKSTPAKSKAKGDGLVNYHVHRSHSDGVTRYGTPAQAKANPGAKIETRREAEPIMVKHLVDSGVLSEKPWKATATKSTMGGQRIEADE